MIQCHLRTLTILSDSLSDFSLRLWKHVARVCATQSITSLCCIQTLQKIDISYSRPQSPAPTTPSGTLVCGKYWNSHSSETDDGFFPGVVYPVLNSCWYHICNCLAYLVMPPVVAIITRGSGTPAVKIDTKRQDGVSLLPLSFKVFELSKML